MLRKTPALIPVFTPQNINRLNNRTLAQHSSLILFLIIYWSIAKSESNKFCSVSNWNVIKVAIFVAEGNFFNYYFLAGLYQALNQPAGPHLKRLINQTLL